MTHITKRRAGWMMAFYTAVTGVALTYVLTLMMGYTPVQYAPLLDLWSSEKVPNTPNMGYYGRGAFSLIVGLLAGDVGIALFFFYKRMSRWHVRLLRAAGPVSFLVVLCCCLAAVAWELIHLASG